MLRQASFKQELRVSSDFLAASSAAPISSAPRCRPATDAPAWVLEKAGTLVVHPVCHPMDQEFISRICHMVNELLVNTKGRPQYLTPLIQVNNSGKCVLLDKCLCMTQAKTGQQLKLHELLIEANLPSIPSPESHRDANSKHGQSKQNELP